MVRLVNFCKFTRLRFHLLLSASPTLVWRSSSVQFDKVQFTSDHSMRVHCGSQKWSKSFPNFLKFHPIPSSQRNRTHPAPIIAHQSWLPKAIIGNNWVKSLRKAPELRQKCARNDASLAQHPSWSTRSSTRSNGLAGDSQCAGFLFSANVQLCAHRSNEFASFEWATGGLSFLLVIARHPLSFDRSRSILVTAPHPSALTRFILCTASRPFFIRITNTFSQPNGPHYWLICELPTTYLLIE